MQEANINQQLTDTNQQFRQLFASVQDEQINVVPFKDSWTAGQLAEHVLKSETAMLNALHTRGKKAGRDPFAHVEHLKNVFLDFSTKLKSPEFIVPEQKEYNTSELLQQFDGIANGLKETIKQVNREEMVSGLPLGEITKGEIIHFIVYHTQRHIHQLQRILEVLNKQVK